ncbi:hypothetical protein CHS0354_023280 [Potamilus streckersoni]|uniref:VWFD domain-containing protein n=1 Tax=Potamilus streckersoni TaxID=2493646 RepID=A0AAE0T5Q7_9BIVA|nr:hypothetical protein CHS0354_023280 [Potamilus streckersoni]
MPEKCIDRYHCGTHDPIWFMGKHPSKEGQEATGKACANTGFGANCCGYEVGTITVKHCGSFFVYRLSRVQGCSFAYCAGKGDPCPYGTSSPTGYQPGCRVSFPMMAGNPILLGPFISGICPDGKRYTDFYFKCQVSYPNPLDANVGFEIKWLIDEKPMNVTNTISGFTREASIHVNQLQNCMGHEFDPGQLELDEKAREMSEIKVVSTVPIPCTDCSVRSSECEYSAHLTAKNATVPECNLTLSYKDWNENTKTAEAITHIEADKDFVNDNKTGYLQLVPFTSGGINAILNASYVPQPLQHRLNDWTQTVEVYLKSGSAGTTDTTLWTDVGYYDMFHVGKFTMVQTKSVPPHIPEFQVEIQTQTCWNVACICGVVAREGTDVVSFNTCDMRFGGNTLNENILFPTQFSNLTIIHQSGKSYMVYFPSGRRVFVDKNDVNMTRVEVQVRPDDANNVEGLCGEYNGHPEELGKDKNGNPITFTRTPDSFIESNRHV